MLPYINVPFEHLSSATGAATDELKLIFTFLLSYPLSGLLKRIPDRNPWQKNVFSISIALLYLVGIFDLWDGLWTLGVSASTAYIMAAYIKDPIMPWMAFVVLMGHMSISHLQRQSKNAVGNVDITGAQMVLVMKLTAFCWNVHDGRLKDEDLSEFQRERAIKAMPNLLDYAGYVLFFPSLMAGPAFDYVEYAKYISTSMFDLPPGVEPSKAPPTRKKRRIPRSGTPAMLKMAAGLVWIFAFLQLGGIYTSSNLLSTEYNTYPLWRRIWLIHAFGFTQRTKYYGVWSLTEGACILAGIGYAGVDTKTGKANWDRLVNIKPLELELAQNTRGYIAAWNINTNNWLRNYMYLRVTAKGHKPGFRSSMATFVTSALWHGFYPGYYMTFVLASVLQDVAKNGRRYIRPFFLTAEGKQLGSKIYYDVFSWFVTQLSFSFIVLPFILLQIKPVIQVWSAVYYYEIVMSLVSMALFASPAKAMLSKRVKALSRPGIQRIKSDGPPDVMLGVPGDPERELQEISAEIKAEIERRRAQGLAVPDVKALVEEKLRELRENAAEGKKEL